MVVSILIWLIAVVSVVGILYAAAFGLLFFVFHVVFITHVRGNGGGAPGPPTSFQSFTRGYKS